MFTARKFTRCTLKIFTRLYIATPNTNKVVIFDTTLRDGEQTLGVCMTLDEKIKIAHQLQELNVDVIEAGFPAISDGEFRVVKLISTEVKNTKICALARATKDDIRIAGEAIKPAQNGRIHVFLATSDLHLNNKLKITRDEAVEKIATGVKLARSYTDDVQAGVEDASRTNPYFLTTFLKEAIDAGATTLNIADTVGYSTPKTFAELIKLIKTNVPNIDQAVLSVHCHNDLGLATANSFEGLMAGARQVECTINGIGERAGNCSLEEIVMAIKTRKDLHNFRCQVNPKELINTSRLVSEITGVKVQPHKPIVGENIFAHVAGIHQHGVMLNKTTYEIIDPTDVGSKKSTHIVSKHSGRHALQEWLERNNIYDVDEEGICILLRDIKKTCEIKKRLDNQDIIKIVNTRAIRKQVLQ